MLVMRRRGQQLSTAHKAGERARSPPQGLLLQVLLRQESFWRREVWRSPTRGGLLPPPEGLLPPLEGILKDSSPHQKDSSPLQKDSSRRTPPPLRMWKSTSSSLRSSPKRFTPLTPKTVSGPWVQPRTQQSLPPTTSLKGSYQYNP